MRQNSNEEKKRTKKEDANLGNKTIISIFFNTLEAYAILERNRSSMVWFEAGVGWNEEK